MAHSSLKQRLLGAGLALSLVGGPALAAPVCQALDAKERASRMDEYFPLRGVKSFRAVTGLGREGSGYDASRNTADRTALEDFVHRLSPDLTIGSYYDQEDNCRLESPFAIYQQRVRRFGADHPYVQQWLAAQRAVLSLCQNPGLEAPKLVPPLPDAAKFSDAVLMNLQEQDRRYQQGSMLFYGEKLTEAVAAFDRIAADRSSPLRPFAAYMGAAIRAGSRPNTMRGGDYAPAPREGSVKELQAILADPSLAPVHGFTASLLGWKSYFSSDPAVLDAQIGEILLALQMPDARLRADRAAADRYDHALSDLKFLLDVDNPDTRNALERAAKSDSLAQWLLNPAPRGGRHGFNEWARFLDRRERDSYTPPLPHSALGTTQWTSVTWYERYSHSGLRNAVPAAIEQTQTCADEQTLALLSTDFHELVRQTLESASPHNTEAFDEAETLLRDYPFKNTQAWGSAVRNSLQYLVVKGYVARARRLRDQLETYDITDYATRNLLMGLAEDMPHLARQLRSANSMPDLFNGISIDAMWQLARRSELQPAQRALLARTAWTRSYVLDRPISLEQDKLMRDLSPEFVRNWRSRPGDAAKPGNVRILQDLLASPGFNIEIGYFSRLSHDQYTRRSSLAALDTYHYSDANWWCALWLDRYDGDKEAALRQMFGDGMEEWVGVSVFDRMPKRSALAPAIRESFLMQLQSVQELEALSRIDCAPKMLTEKAVRWVRDTQAGAETEDQAEALANAVRATRYGCSRQGSHADYSRAAYDLLKARFPQTAAAQRTKYWFDCPRSFDGCKAEDPLNTPSRR
jgi:hypothetical protein